MRGRRVAVIALVALAGCGSSSMRPHTDTTATSVPPGVVTVARVAAPAGGQVTLTLQRIRFEGGQYLCLYAHEPPAPPAPGAPPPPGGSASGTCAGPLPLPNRPLAAVTATFVGCRSELVWGLARSDASVRVGTLSARRAAVPASLRVPGSLFYAWGPGAVVARGRSGNVIQRSTVGVVSSCPPGPSHGQPVHPYRPGPVQLAP